MDPDSDDPACSTSVQNISRGIRPWRDLGTLGPWREIGTEVSVRVSYPKFKVLDLFGGTREKMKVLQHVWKMWKSDVIFWIMFAYRELRTLLSHHVHRVT